MPTDRPPGRLRPPDGVAGAIELLLDLPFTEHDLPAVRRAVAAHADPIALPGRRKADLVLIASELASNAIRHGGGRGRLRLWGSPDALHCVVADEGPGLADHGGLPRQRPEPTAPGGRGLWLVRRFADALAIEGREGVGTTVTATLWLTGER